MNAIKNVFNALSNVTASLNALAGVIDMASNRLRQQLEHEPAAPLPALPHGEIIDAAADGPAPRRKVAAPK
jgi:hypothetical protein